MPVGGKRRRIGDLEPNPAMWEALEEGKKLREILEDFYDRVYEDARLSPFFSGVTKDHAVGKQYSFLADKFSGSKLYFGDRPRNAHHWMVISDELFDYRERLMEECLQRAGLAEERIAEWMSLEEIFRKQIVKAKPFGRKLRGKEMPLEGYEVLEMSCGTICDGCEQEIAVGATVACHVRLGKTYCQTCMPNPEPPRYAKDL